MNPAEKEAAETYIKKVTAMQEAAGAVTLARHPIAAAFIGDLEVDVVAIVEFPSQSAFDEVFESEEYKALIPLRERAFSKLHAFVSNSK